MSEDPVPYRRDAISDIRHLQQAVKDKNDSRSPVNGDQIPKRQECALICLLRWPWVLIAHMLLSQKVTNLFVAHFIDAIAFLLGNL